MSFILTNYEGLGDVGWQKVKASFWEWPRPKDSSLHRNLSPSFTFFPTPWLLKVSELERWNTGRTGTQARTTGLQCHIPHVRVAHLRRENPKQSSLGNSQLHDHRQLKRHTAPNATASMVCIRASSRVLRSPFLLRRALPARVQNLTCFTPTETNWESESGRNSATKIRWLWPALLAILAPKKKDTTEFSRWV